MAKVFDFFLFCDGRVTSDLAGSCCWCCSLLLLDRLQDLIQSSVLTQWFVRRFQPQTDLQS
jgi:hypothetical protein